MSNLSDIPESPELENPKPIEESIVVFGATGLVGSRIVKALSRTVNPNQMIYVFSRDIIMHDRPQVIPKYFDAGSWVEELSKISNITKVYCALGATRPHRFIDHNTYENFYQVNHNLFYQIAVASKNLNVPTFIMISGFNSGYIIPKLFDRKTIVRAATERDITNLGFEHLVIIRPGPLAGIREKRGSLKLFSTWSIIEGLAYIAKTPYYFINPATPGLTFSFGTSVGKAAVSLTSNPNELDSLTIINHFDIMKGAYKFNSYIYNEAIKKISKMSKVSIPENATDSETHEIVESFNNDMIQLVKLVLGEKFSIDGQTSIKVLQK